ncbi:jg2102 [Pararge aegeria aegeria]|uniref:Jg2102 protein n=1 Tax=Pararge aegeria aegeria TaxID=348720 RepID=A0A8S4QPZ9_9NEOP|nr:jg2102 [Pararge aegeria aegeria]
MHAPGQTPRVTLEHKRGSSVRRNKRAGPAAEGAPRRRRAAPHARDPPASTGLNAQRLRADFTNHCLLLGGPPLNNK